MYSYIDFLLLYSTFCFMPISHIAFYVHTQVGLVARMYSAANGPLALGDVPPALTQVVEDAELEAVFPDGHRLKKRMHDDGLHNDGAANDGVYGASFAATEIGSYTVQAMLLGAGDNGPFIRTTQHLVEVVPRMLQLTSLALYVFFLSKNLLI